MIASNYIKNPKALRFQCEMFSNGYKNSPRIMRLMTVIFKQVPDVPGWVKKAQAAAKRLVKMWKGQQMTLNFKSPKAYTTQAEADATAMENLPMCARWAPSFQVDQDFDDEGNSVETMQYQGRYISFCRRHQHGYQGHAGSMHRNSYPG